MTIQIFTSLQTFMLDFLQKILKICSSFNSSLVPVLKPGCSGYQLQTLRVTNTEKFALKQNDLHTAFP